MKRVLLTGAGGFIGHHVLAHFLDNTDWEIVCITSPYRPGKSDRIQEILKERPLHADRVVVSTHDLREPIPPQLMAQIGSIDYLVSIASWSHVQQSIDLPRPFVENNVRIALTLGEYVRQCFVEKVLHLSSAEVFGPAPDAHDFAEGELHRPSSPYAASKAMQEDIFHALWRTYRLPIGIVNAMNLIGERQDSEKLVPFVVGQIVNGGVVPIYASEEGRPGSRFYLHARNLADALLFLLRTQPFPVYGDGEMGRWNVVGEREVDNLEMAALIAEYAGEIDFEYELVNFHESRPGHDLRYALDGSKMRDLGWKPPIPLETSLRKTVEWTLANPQWPLD